MTKGSLNTNRFTDKGKNTPSQEKAIFVKPINNTILGADKSEKVRQNNYMECNLLEVNEVCQLLKIGRSTLYGLVNSKSLRAVKLLGHTLFRQQDLVEFVSSLNAYEGGSNGF